MRQLGQHAAPRHAIAHFSDPHLIGGGRLHHGVIDNVANRAPGDRRAGGRSDGRVHDQQSLADVVEGTDVRGILAGHLHFSTWSTFQASRSRLRRPAATPAIPHLWTA